MTRTTADRSKETKPQKTATAGNCPNPSVTHWIFKIKKATLI
jgi:hypothetical protein